MTKNVIKVFDPSYVVAMGDDFLIANGNIGYRGTLAEFDKQQYGGFFILNLYSQVPGKPNVLASLPNPLYAYLTVNGEDLSILKTPHLDHKQTIDYEHAVFSRKTVYQNVTFAEERFTDCNFVNNMACRYTITSDIEQEITLNWGIDYDQHDRHGPHLVKDLTINFEADQLGYVGETNQSKFVVILASINSETPDLLITGKEEVNKTMKHLTFKAKPGQVYEFDILITVDFGKNREFVLDKCYDMHKKYGEVNYNYRRKKHRANWEILWDRHQIDIVGHRQAHRAVSANVYYSLIFAPRVESGVPAFGLSSQFAFGAIFPNNETMMIPYYLVANPPAARNILKYRINRLQGAKKKAHRLGYKGAFYPFASQVIGDEGVTINMKGYSDAPFNVLSRDANTTIYTSALVTHSIYQYFVKTNDFSILIEDGARVMIETCIFFMDRATHDARSGYYNFLGVTGPDEYHLRVNNSAPVNYLIRYAIQETVNALKALEHERPKEYEKLMAMYPDFHLYDLRFFLANIRPYRQNDDGVIEGFDGYFDLPDSPIENGNSKGKSHLKVSETKRRFINDIGLLMIMFTQNFTPSVRHANNSYYYQFSERMVLNKIIYALLGVRGKDFAEPFETFIEIAEYVFAQNRIQFYNNDFIGGISPGDTTNVLNIVLFGFCGYYRTHTGVNFKPNIPPSIKKIVFKFYENGKLRQATVTNAKVSVINIEEKPLE